MYLVDVHLSFFFCSSYSSSEPSRTCV